MTVAEIPVLTVCVDVHPLTVVLLGRDGAPEQRPGPGALLGALSRRPRSAHQDPGGTQRPQELISH